MKTVLKIIAFSFLMAAFLWVFMLAQSMHAQDMYVNGYIAGATACFEQEAAL